MKLNINIDAEAKEPEITITTSHMTEFYLYLHRVVRTSVLFLE